jgi:hypothetical protein
MGVDITERGRQADRALKFAMQSTAPASNVVTLAGVHEGTLSLRAIRATEEGALIAESLSRLSKEAREGIVIFDRVRGTATSEEINVSMWDAIGVMVLGEIATSRRTLASLTVFDVVNRNTLALHAVIPIPNANRRHTIVLPPGPRVAQFAWNPGTPSGNEEFTVIAFNAAGRQMFDRGLARFTDTAPELEFSGTTTLLEISNPPFARMVIGASRSYSWGTNPVGYLRVVQVGEATTVVAKSMPMASDGDRVSMATELPPGVSQLEVITTSQAAGIAISYTIEAGG